MTIPETAAQLRAALGNCVNAAKDISPAERDHFTAAQNDSSDEEVITFWLSVSYLGQREVAMFVAEQWEKRETNISERMALGISLHRQTTDASIVFCRCA